MLQDDSNLLAAMEANYLAYFVGFAQLPYLQLHNDAEMTWLTSNLRYWNVVLRTHLATGDVAGRIERTLSYYKDMPLMWHILPSTRPSDLGRYLVQHGLKPIGGRPHMAADLLSLPAKAPTLHGLVIERVHDGASFDRWFRATVAGFEMPAADAQIYFEAYKLLGFGQEGPFLHYIGYLNGEPVTSSTLLLADGIAGIYDVSTAPLARGRGLGSAITLAPLLEARARGFRYAVLQSSEMGYNVYQRLGFRERYREDNYLLEK